MLPSLDSALKPQSFHGRNWPKTHRRFPTLLSASPVPPSPLQFVFCPHRSAEMEPSKVFLIALLRLLSPREASGSAGPKVHPPPPAPWTLLSLLLPRLTPLAPESRSSVPSGSSALPPPGWSHTCPPQPGFPPKVSRVHVCTSDLSSAPDPHIRPLVLPLPHPSSISRPQMSVILYAFFFKKTLLLYFIRILF